MSDSLKKRYFFKLSTNLLGLIFSLITAGIIPRGLGPQAYGDFNFIQNFFTRIFGFFDSGTSTAFYSKLSQRQNESGIISFYFRLVGIILFIISVFILIINLTKLNTYILPDQKNIFIFMGLIWLFFYFFNNIFLKIMDAFGWTVQSEIARMLIKAIGVIIIIILFLINFLNLKSYFIYQFFLFFSFILVSIFIIFINKKVLIINKWKLEGIEIRNYSKEFYDYCSPLLFLNFFVMIFNILERWMLQKFSGSVEQGFFGFSYRITNFCFLFTSAMYPLLLRELSIAFKNNDKNKIYSLFRKNVPLLFSISTYFACFIALQAKNIIYIFGGDKFQGALIPLTIMAFSPIYMTYSYLAGSVFLASGKTKLTRNIGLIRSFSGIILAYFLLAPTKFFGLELDSTGLAIKTVIIQFIGVNIQLFFISKIIKISFLKLLFHQIIVIIIFLFISFLSKWSIMLFIENNILIFIISGILYTLIIFILLLSIPILFGFSYQEIVDKIIKFKKIIINLVSKKNKQ